MFHSKLFRFFHGYLHVQDSLDAAVQFPSFSSVEVIVYLTGLRVPAISRAESQPGVIGQLEAEIPGHDDVPSRDWRVRAFPYQSRRHDHLQLQTSKYGVITATEKDGVLSSGQPLQ